MQNVHSTKSVTAMMKAARERVADGKGKGVVQPSNASNEVPKSPNYSIRDMYFIVIVY